MVECINEKFFPLDMNIKIQIIRFILTLYNRKKLDDFLYSNTIVFQNEKNEIALILPCPAYSGAKIILLNKLDDECLDYPDFDILKTNKIPTKSSRKVN